MLLNIPHQVRILKDKAGKLRIGNVVLWHGVMANLIPVEIAIVSTELQ